MSEVLSLNEIDTLLDAIHTPSTPSGNERLYDFKKPELLSSAQQRLLEKHFNNVRMDISNYFANMFEQTSFLNFVSIDCATIESFINQNKSQSYLYKFELGSVGGYISVDASLFTTLFAKEKYDPNNSGGKFEKGVCCNYLARPVLEKLKPLFSFSGKKSEYTKIENTTQPVNNYSTSIIISTELNTTGSDGKSICTGKISYILSKELISKMKFDGILKNDNIVYLKHEKGNAAAVAGELLVQDNAKIENGKLYKFNSTYSNRVDIYHNGKKIAVANPIIFFGNYSVKVTNIFTVEQNANSQKTKAVIGRFTIPENAILNKDQIINLDRDPSDFVDIEKDGKTIAQGEIIATDNFFGVKITSIL